MPITWRNVNAPTATGASRILDSAGRSFNKGLGQLTGLADEFTNIGNRNQANTNRRNTDDALAGINQLGSLDQLEAARQSGQFDPTNLPAGVDAKAVRNALADRGNVIDDTLSKENAFANRQIGRDEQAGQLQFDQLLQEGNYSGASELAKTFNNPASGLSRIEQAKQGDTNRFRQERDYRENRLDKQNAPIREANLLQLNHENRIAEIKYQQSLLSTPKVLSDSDNTSAIGGHLNRLTNSETGASNDVTFDSATHSAGAEGRAAISKGIAALEQKYGYKVPEDQVGALVDRTLQQFTGKDNTFFRDDNSFNPKQMLAELDVYMQKSPNNPSDVTIRNTASELAREEEKFNNNLKRINDNRGIRFQPR